MEELNEGGGEGGREGRREGGREGGKEGGNTAVWPLHLETPDGCAHALQFCRRFDGAGRRCGPCSAQEVPSPWPLAPRPSHVAPASVHTD